MQRTYGDKWSSRYGNADDGSWWQLLQGVEPAIIGKAILAFETNGNPWPPTKPEFIAMCKVQMGLPDVAKAYRDANHTRWTHEVVYETARRVGVYEVRSLPEKQIYPAWERTYATVTTEWMAGARFQKPDPEQKRIGDKTVVHRQTPEVANNEIAKMRALLGMGAGT